MKLANILLVEDCDVDAAFFRDFFERQRICNQVTRVCDYQGAWLYAQSVERFDLLVVDIRIPGAGGLELVERIKTLPGNDGVPVIVTSGVDAEAQVKEACRLGVLAFSVKPLTAEMFWPVIQELKKLHIGLMVRERHDLRWNA
jgi:CheY-like chemotaxis protein